MASQRVRRCLPLKRQPASHFVTTQGRRGKYRTCGRQREERKRTRGAEAFMRLAREIRLRIG